MLRALLHDLLEELRRVAEHTKPPARVPNREETLTVGTGLAPAVVRTYGRHYNMVFCAATTAVVLAIPGIGIGIAVNLPGAQWTVLNLPDGSEITSVSATPVNILYRATDDSQGGVF